MILKDCMIEPAAAVLEPGITFQFERKGYFCRDAGSAEDALIINRTIALRDTWAKMQNKRVH